MAVSARDDRDLARAALPGEERVNRAAYAALDDPQRSGLRRLWPFLGPAFIAAIAYVDPGNFATNFAAGAGYGYRLLWVIALANVMAMVIQMLSAKLGIATGMNLAEACRERFRTPVRVCLWLVAEAVAMATDLAEFVGASLAMYLLFDMPLLVAAAVTAAISFAVLGLQSRGARHLESAITMLMLVIVSGFAWQLWLSPPDAAGAAGGLLPSFAGGESVLLACGILGATVMPHVIYLHSALTQRRVAARSDAERLRVMRFERIDVVIAMAIAGLVNASMLMIAASAFTGIHGVDTLEAVFSGLGQRLGHHADVAFGIALLASGLSSSSVGTLSGQVVMAGFLRRHVSLLVRRVVTMLPALAIIAFGADPTYALVISQVVLSFGIPFALIPLILFTRDATLMGPLVNRRLTTVTAWACAAIIVSLNAFLLVQLAG
jgi:manganese transport protein